MTEAMLVALALFVAWGSLTSPHRPFSWGMYSGSAKAFLWTELPDHPRVLGYDELGLAPDSHFLSLPELRKLADQKPLPAPAHGLIVGYRYNWLVTGTGGRAFRVTGPLPPGAELDQLVALLRRLPVR